MKIAILTLPLHTNYGGILQAYALQTVLERMGHEVTHLQPKVEYPRLHNPLVMPLVWCKRLYRKFILGNIALPVFVNREKKIRTNTDKFISKHLKCRYLKPEEWNEGLAREYDAIVVGSDQVWRPIYSPDVTKYFTSFLGDAEIKRLAYAVSFGVDINEYSEDQMAAGQKYLKRFSAISVREEPGIGMCRNYFNVEACRVLDPTMLLDYTNYLTFASTAPKSPGNLMVYILDQTEKMDAFVDAFADKHALIPFRTNSKPEVSWGLDIPFKERIQPPIENWLRGFIDAEFVLTDSFHACVFSILFHKPFGVFINHHRGLSRIESLLSPLGLMDRCVSCPSMQIDAPIDWSRVDDTLAKWRKKSMNFLWDALESNE